MVDYKLKNTILHLENVELGYGEGANYKCVLKDINITEKDVVIEGQVTGQSIAIIGRSGRGKSTLFKAITGLVKPRNGQILLTETDTENPNDAKIVSEGDVGFVDQKYTLFRHKTVEQILMYAQRNSDKTKEEKEEIVTQYLENWGLAKQRKQYPNELSGGQRQRTAIIEQILCSGHFMVFDEPTSGLDMINLDDVKQVFRLIQSQDELNTIIFSTHDIEFAVEMADSIYIIGHPEDTDDYSTIVHHIDLKSRGLAWAEQFTDDHEDISKEIKGMLGRGREFTADHLEIVSEIKNVFSRS